MSKSAMLRTRRRDVNVKPNRRLDRKSSRGMIYENEELRLRTININAEIERGQSDIKKLRRENEQLRKEIWCLRDEYEKLDKLLKNKEDRTSCSSCTSDTDSCTSCSESEENETTQNIENVQKTTLNNLRTEFDHLSVVTEETSAENSDKNSNCATSPKECLWEALPPDQSYPNSQTLPLRAEQMPRHFFAPLKTSQSYDNCHENNFDKLAKCAKTAPDILVKTDGQESNTNSFTNGGNLDELLHDIQSISNDILEISKTNEETIERPYKSELNVVLMPKSMPLLGFDKYQNIKSSLESLTSIKKSIESLHMLDIPPPDSFTPQPFPTDFLNFPPPPIPPPEFNRQCSNPFFNGSNCLQAHDNFGFKNEVIQQSSAKAEEKIDEIVENKPEKEAKEKPQRTRKVSIYFKGKKDKLARSLSLDTKLPQDTTSGESKTSLFESPKNPETENKTSSDSKNSNYDRKHRKSSSTSPERKHVHIKPENEKKCHKKRHRKSDRRLPATRRTSVSADRSFSICTDRSNILDNKFGHFEDYTNSERDRSNSLSSCDTVKSRKLSAPPQFQVSGKIPWFGCWGNGCL